MPKHGTRVPHGGHILFNVGKPIGHVEPLKPSTVARIYNPATSIIAAAQHAANAAARAQALVCHASGSER